MKAVAVFMLVAAVLDIAAGQSIAEQYLNPHNRARQEVGASIPNLRWNDELTAFATNWANDRATNAGCALSHSKGPYGENISWFSGSSSPADAVKLWVDEKQYYNYGSNSCQSGKVCGHYTQVVWRNTQLVGCGSARCPGGGTFVVCSYYPRGNFNGERPYLQSETLTSIPVEGSREEA